MIRELGYYLVATVMLVGGLLLIERLVAGSHSRAGTGFSRIDGAFDFDRLRSRHAGTWLRSVLLRRGPAALPVLEPVGDRHQVRAATEQFIPVAAIRGSVGGASHLFDRDFRPISERSRARLGHILVAMREGESLPPIEVWAARGQYFVVDGHHRVAAARALGIRCISACVVTVI